MSTNPHPDTADTFTEIAWPYQVLAKASAHVGADPTEARLIKFTNNAAFALPASGLVVRISGSSPVAHRARTVVAVARWLAEHEMPTIRLATTLPQPLDIDGHAVTFWKLVPDTGPQPTGHDLGRILRRFHALPDTSADLPAWNTLGMIRVRIGAADFLAPDERVFLTKTADAIASDLDDVDYLWEPGPIHGDPIIGNLIPGPDGPVLCDFDSTCTGPREWDLIPAAVGQLRFRYAIDYHAQLTEAYGTDIRTWSGFGVFRRLRELQLVCSALPTLSTDTRFLAQWRHRFDTLRAGDLDAQWALYR